MRIFELTAKNWGCRKINFVDDNNVFVGYEYEDQCCEQFGFYITNEEPKEVDFSLNETIHGLHYRHNFDTEYCKHIEGENREDTITTGVVFKLTKSGVEDAFLVLYNSHEGHYHHGFKFGTVGCGDEFMQEGEI